MDSSLFPIGAVLVASGIGVWAVLGRPVRLEPVPIPVLVKRQR